MASSKFPQRTRSVGLLLVLLIAALLFSSPSANAGSSLERGLGKQVAQQLEEEIGTVRDPALAGWVTRVGTRLVLSAGSNPRDYSFQILDSDDVNAFAVPGGYIYVTMGLLRFVESEDELAAVLGHETAHITSRHGMQQLQRDLLLSLALSLLRSRVPALVSNLGEVGGLLYSLKHSRSDEAEADHVGMSRLAAAGYDPAAMVAFLGRLAETEKHRPSRFEVYFMTHPPTAERLTQAQQAPEADPHNREVRIAVARGLFERGLYQQALQNYTALAAGQPADATLDQDAERCRAALTAGTLPPSPAVASSALVAAASARVVDAHAAIGAARDRRVKACGDLREHLDGSSRRFRYMLQSLNNAAATVSQTDLVRREFLRRLALAVADLDKSLSRVTRVVERGEHIPDSLAADGEKVNRLLAGPAPDAQLAAIAETYAPTATDALAALDESFRKGQDALKRVDSGMHLCEFAAQDMQTAASTPAPFLLSLLDQVHGRVFSAAAAARAALRTAGEAEQQAASAAARQRVFALDLQGWETPAARRPALYALLSRRFDMDAAQVEKLAQENAPLGQSAASLLLGMAAAQPKGKEKDKDKKAGPIQVKPLPLNAAIARKQPLAPLDLSLRLLGLEAARENGTVAQP